MRREIETGTGAFRASKIMLSIFGIYPKNDREYKKYSLCVHMCTQKEKVQRNQICSVQCSLPLWHGKPIVKVPKRI